jgi:hypothetical protein
MMENANLLRLINESPLGVDAKLPRSINKIDHCIHSSPRCVRLSRENQNSITSERARFLQKVTENGRRLSISALNDITPFHIPIGGAGKPYNAE